MTLAEYLKVRIEADPASGCWRWKGAVRRNGYSHTTYLTRSVYVHRLAYEAFVGPIPDGMTLDHLCHTRDRACHGGDACPHRRCVNPSHLEPVSLKENVHRGRGPCGKNASKTECVHGHPFTPANTMVMRNGHRVCRACFNARARDYYHRVRRPKHLLAKTAAEGAR